MTTTPTRRRMRSASVALGVTALTAAGLSGCASSPDYAAICVDPETEERVDDDECDDADESVGSSSVGSGFFWYYLGASSRVPAVGSGVSGGSFRTPSSGSLQRGGLDSGGADSVRSTTRGGFGGSSSSRGFSG
ncbi:hypothetical protein GCM10009737_23520 [Nocardioides lentus]|uniref:tRNA-dihydrouridine synthase n=1 Tax=Nocardioides lentus TaxID=338077 RepID=A0ABP5AVK8_9ACTN